jgi:hypothetical protein
MDVSKDFIIVNDIGFNFLFKRETFELIRSFKSKKFVKGLVLLDDQGFPVFAHDETMMLTFEGNECVVYDIAHSIELRRIKLIIKGTDIRPFVYNDYLFVWRSPNNILAKYSILTGEYLTSYNGLVVTFFEFFSSSPA